MASSNTPKLRRIVYKDDSKNGCVNRGFADALNTEEEGKKKEEYDHNDNKAQSSVNKTCIDVQVNGKNSVSKLSANSGSETHRGFDKSDIVDDVHLEIKNKKSDKALTKEPISVNNTSSDKLFSTIIVPSKEPASSLSVKQNEKPISTTGKLSQQPKPSVNTSKEQKQPASTTTASQEQPPSTTIASKQPASTTTASQEQPSSTSDASKQPASTTTASQEQPSSTSDASKDLSDNPDGVWLTQFESSLRTLVDDQPEEIKNLLHVNESFFMNRLVQIVDGKTGGQITVDSLMDELRRLVYGSKEDKLRFLYDVYNIDGDSGIDKHELQQFFTSVIDEYHLSIDKEGEQELIDTFFNTADHNPDGKISFEALQTMFQRRSSIVDNITISSMFSSKIPQTKPGLTLNDEIKKRSHLRHFSRTYIRNNLRKVLSLACYALINMVLMGVALYKYWDSNAWIKVARAHGMALNFNCTFVLVLMLRRTLTWLRNTPLRKILPFDQHIWFHRLCGYFIAILSIGHTIGHVGNCVYIVDISNATVPEMLFTTKAGIGWVGHSAYITGDILVVVLVVMVVLSLPIIRRSGNFEVFYWSHMLFLVFWAVLIIHAPDFWKWFVVPGFIFILELLARNSWIQMFSMGKTYIRKATLFPSGVTHIIISRPPGFNFKPGDYLFIQIPAVAKYEKHPFTISSSPENKDEMCVHIRTAGHWTKSVYKYFTDYQSDDAEMGTGDGIAGDNSRGLNTKGRTKPSLRRLKSDTSFALTGKKKVISKKVKVRVHIDGPYGTPSRDIFDQEHAVLIGSGIGITPFASILQSIVSRYKASCVQCPSCSHRWCHQPPEFAMTLKKVDFVWINRDQKQFEWFAYLLARLEREQEVQGGVGGIVDTHIYMTSLPAKSDMRGMGLQLALDLVHDDDHACLLTGFRTRTQCGRPDFDKLFLKIKNKAEGRRVKVFFCGSPLLGTTLKLYSNKYNFAFAHEYF